MSFQLQPYLITLWSLELHSCCACTATDQSRSFSEEICSAYNGKIKLTGSEEELLWKENVTSAIWRYFWSSKKGDLEQQKELLSLSKWRLRKKAAYTMFRK